MYGIFCPSLFFVNQKIQSKKETPPIQEEKETTNSELGCFIEIPTSQNYKENIQMDEEEEEEEEEENLPKTNNIFASFEKNDVGLTQRMEKKTKSDIHFSINENDYEAKQRLKDLKKLIQRRLLATQQEDVEKDKEKLHEFVFGSHNNSFKLQKDLKYREMIEDFLTNEKTKDNSLNVLLKELLYTSEDKARDTMMTNSPRFRSDLNEHHSEWTTIYQREILMSLLRVLDNSSS